MAGRKDRRQRKQTAFKSQKTALLGSHSHRAALALALVRNLLLDHGRQWQIEYLCEEIGLRAQAFTAGSKLGMTQLQYLLVLGFNGGAILRMQLDQEPLQSCTIIRQYVDVQRG